MSITSKDTRFIGKQTDMIGVVPHGVMLIGAARSLVKLLLSVGATQSSLLTGDGGTYNSAVVLTAAGRIFTSGKLTAPYTLSGIISGSYPLILEGLADEYRLVLTGNNTYSGATTVKGLVQIGNGEETGSPGTGSIILEGRLHCQRSGDMTLASNISGPGRLIKSGTGTLALRGNNTFTGGLVIEGGALSLTAAGQAGSGVVSLTSSSHFALPGNYLSGNSVEMTGGTLTLNGSAGTSIRYTFTRLWLKDVTLASVDSGVGDNHIGITSPVQIEGLVNWTSGSAGSYQRTCSLSGGLSGSGTLNSNDTWGGHPHCHAVSGNCADFTGTLATATTSVVPLDIECAGLGVGSRILVRNATVGINTGTQYTSRLIVTKYAGDFNSPGTTLQIDGGTVQTSYNVTVGTLTGTGGQFQTVAGKNLTFGAPGVDAGYAGVISGAGRLIKAGTGVQTLSGRNTFTGGTTINAGTLRAANTAAFGTGTITVNAGATLDKNGLAVTNTIINNGGTVIG